MSAPVHFWVYPQIPHRTRAPEGLALTGGRALDAVGVAAVALATDALALGIAAGALVEHPARIAAAASSAARISGGLRELAMTNASQFYRALTDAQTPG
jgi:alkanesulfonate monooxygenase SsuD/methylene tetrahydromethanopterin reductase-like flavin-dependent oxidoreductase (luciferase family)